MRANPELNQADVLRAAKGLARALRADPDLGGAKTKELAESLGIPEELVHQVLASIRMPKARAGSGLGAQSKHIGKAILSGMLAVWLNVTRRPLLFVALTTLLGGAGIASFILRQDLSLQKEQIENAQTYIGLAVVLLHVGLYANHARLRCPAFGGLIVWAALIGISMLQRWVDFGPEQTFGSGMAILQTTFVAFLIAFQYAVIGGVAAVAGSYVSSLRLERAVEGMPRQELLARLFEIQKQLGVASGPSMEPTAKRLHLVERYRRIWPIHAAGVGLCFGTLYVLVFTYLGSVQSVTSPISYLSFTVSFALMLLEFVLIVGLSFFAGSIWRALGAAWTYQLATILPLLLDLGKIFPNWAFGPEYVRAVWGKPESLRWLLLYTTGLSLVAGIGAAVEQRAQRQRRLRQNDPAALMAEMVRIEWLLSNKATDVCVLVVDVARSSQMKAESDPLESEYSFREYHRFVETVCATYGGHVHSTAGDGAVVAFHDVRRAFEAGRSLQTEVEGFNRTQNRLAVPFRLRVGIHVGHVAAELNKVQFTEVIDLAAHAQATAPVGGIAVTEAAAASLDKSTLLPLKESIAGQALYIAANPTNER